jgi:hypothetical protein
MPSVTDRHSWLRERRDRDKRPDPEHVGNVPRNRLRQPECSHELSLQLKAFQQQPGLEASDHSTLNTQP